MTPYEKACAEACPDGCGEGLELHRYVSESLEAALPNCKYCYYNDGELTAHHHVVDKAIPCTAPTRDEFEQALQTELEEVRGARKREIALHAAEMTRSEMKWMDVANANALERESFAARAIKAENERDQQAERIAELEAALLKPCDCCRTSCSHGCRCSTALAGGKD